MIDKIKYVINIVTYKTYRDMRDEWNTQNRQLDVLQAEVGKKDKKIEEIENNHAVEIATLNSRHERVFRRLKKESDNLKEQVEEIQKDFDIYVEERIAMIEGLDEKLKEKESQRKSAVGKLTAANKKIKKLEEQIEELSKPKVKKTTKKTKTVDVVVD